MSKTNTSAMANLHARCEFNHDPTIKVISSNANPESECSFLEKLVLIPILLKKANKVDGKYTKLVSISDPMTDRDGN